MESVAQLNPAWFVVIMSAVAVIPIGFALLTSYLKMSIVFGMVKNALGTQSSPSTLTVLALSGALTCFTMGPILEESMKAASSFDAKQFLQAPSVAGLSSLSQSFQPWRAFLHRHAGTREIAALSSISDPQLQIKDGSQGGGAEHIGLRVLIPAFIITELKEGFAMGFVLLLPFLVIDLIVANILVGLGMTMVSPVMIALPIKLLLFIVSDGWLLLAKGLVFSYQ